MHLLELVGLALLLTIHYGSAQMNTTSTTQRPNGTTTWQPSTISPNSTSACGGYLSANTSSQAFSSPGYPSTYYPNNAYCDWILTAPNGTTIQLQFAAFNTEQGYDFVTITNRLTGAMLASYSGPQSSFPPIITCSSSVLVNFRSDSSVTFSGFQMNYWTMPSSAGCQASSGNTSTTTYPPYSSYPTSYPNSSYPPGNSTLQGPSNSIAYIYNSYTSLYCSQYGAPYNPPFNWYLTALGGNNSSQQTIVSGTSGCQSMNSGYYTNYGYGNCDLGIYNGANAASGLYTCSYNNQLKSAIVLSIDSQSSNNLPMDGYTGIAEGTNVTFTCGFHFNGSVQYFQPSIQWYVYSSYYQSTTYNYNNSYTTPQPTSPSSVFTNATGTYVSSTVTFQAVAPGLPQYSCGATFTVVNPPAGCATNSPTYGIQYFPSYPVMAPPRTVTIQTSNTTSGVACAGVTNITCSADGNPSPAIQWEYPGGFINLVLQPTITVKQVGNNVVYICHASNSLGTVAKSINLNIVNC